ncbi:MAG: 4-hydroxy-tetrahydrodipicolinate synthase [Proteiniphilum sp.]|jgi:4-hydroxy-tetrahydrodipicolinate synthase|nr:4-hydroxy-tetrahydrodipicolinate synthase [Proteiniphilum sp.]MDD2937992.1 4-hydroxy-tetrahydrodipicolinate synthase [Proteiniphilum sp.]MDD3076685.1 4-hydroxy-tetrahydrodipicolinate synthase [Proteiniphilum sp.]MDD3956560.1 4-hydroxy-tetrahydrodipicolinate synthase [Proteiniphilum sp.]MDD4452304.1 4-hydroxy-tetrahydrodipicolinate synthase [Proteiniphilum sp.]
MSNIHFQGLGVALITPFCSDGSIAFDALSQLLDYQLGSGIDYIVALGTTAETPTLTKKERAAVVRFIVEKVDGRIPVVMGVGGNNTADVVDDLRSADFTGISAVLSVTPYYNKPTQEGLFQHYHALSQASPLPIILYNVPGRTGVNMTAETTLRIARSCKNVVAVKEASGNLDQIKAIIDGAPQGFHLISGDDGITTAVIQMGGIGVISVFGNAFPKEMAWLVESALKGNALDARNKMERDFNRLFHLIFVEGNPAGVKCILHLKGMIENILRLPLVPVSEKTMLEIKEELGRFS